MNRISTWLAVVVGIITLLGGALGTAFTIDSRYAKSEEIAIIKDYVQQVDKRLELKILKDRANALQERMWKIEDRYGMEIAKMTEEVREQYRELKKEYDDIMEKIKKDGD
tara:strand:- start:592 stop:921 length:330 start_codon:yes stop_codon:yes gene_type:complete